jgi:hypothetical protein
MSSADGARTSSMEMAEVGTIDTKLEAVTRLAQEIKPPLPSLEWED